MLKRLFIFCLVFFLVPAAFAVETPLDTKDKMVGEGPKGRFTQEQAQEIALGVVPGEVKSTEGWWNDNRYYVGVVILREDGSIFDVEINTLTGKIHNIAIDSLVPGSSLPMDVIAQNIAEAVAVSHVNDKVHGAAKAEILKSQIIVHERQPVYRIEVKKLVHKYEVLVNAVTGKIKSFKESD
ncbi:MAG TPA: hypothetical protein DEA55_03450 [Rhodospirillaceae bacterium]|nr:hypothetical protein [Rhodospirillaceae bacterium]